MEKPGKPTPPPPPGPEPQPLFGFTQEQYRDRLHGNPAKPASCELKLNTLEILIQPHGHVVELDLMVTSVEMLNAICVLAAKSWCTGPLMMQFLDLLALAMARTFGDHERAGLFPGDKPMRLDWLRGSCELIKPRMPIRKRNRG